MTFFDRYSRYGNFEFGSFFSRIGVEDVQRTLEKEKLAPEDYLTLLSPAAGSCLEAMAETAHALTIRNFGRVIFLFTPLYLSDYCENQCLYCSFNREHPFIRRKMTEVELIEEAEEISGRDIKHLLILTGESRLHTPPSYLKNCVRILNRYFSSISLEVYPLTLEEYGELIELGVDGLTIYQEVYDEEVYDRIHVAGPKKDYHYRLDTPERACRAGMRTVTIGPLLGMADWRRETFFAGLHAEYLQNIYWDTEINLSFPRLRPHTGSFETPCPVEDREFVQILLAARIYLPRAGLTVSTRESATLRENILPLGVTKMSAWSSTEVGGHGKRAEGTGQFEISDNRDINEMKQMLLGKGYQPIFKDWHRV